MLCSRIILPSALVVVGCGHASITQVGDDGCIGPSCNMGVGGAGGVSGSGATGGQPNSSAGDASVPRGSGGSSAGGSGGSTGTGGMPTSAGPTFDMIDNLDDGDGRIRMSGGRQGPWHTFNSAPSNGGNQVPAFTAVFTPEMGGANNTTYAVHTSGDGYTYAGVGFDLNNATMVEESPQSQSYDASAWDGLVFYAKGTANLRVEFSMKQFVPTDRGGSCSGDACWNVYGSRDIQGKLNDGWQQFKIPFSSLQREMGGTDPAFDAHQLMDISFKHEGNNDRFDFWIDEVQFYKDPPSSGGTTTDAGGGGGGGNGSSMCTLPAANNGGGSYTTYWFGQGTGMEGDGFRTACGYFGHETGGDGTTDRVENIANPAYFAAVPSQSSSNFDTSKYCGACVEASLNGRSVVATIIDACPIHNDQNQTINTPCANNPTGHLDLSLPAANALGFGMSFPTNTTWRFVPCPVTGNVIVRIKPGNANQVYIENEVLPIQSVTMNGGQATRLSYGAWQVPGAAAGQTLQLTDSSGRTISVQVTGGDGENTMTSAQFPACNP